MCLYHLVVVVLSRIQHTCLIDQHDRRAHLLSALTGLSHRLRQNVLGGDVELGDSDHLTGDVELGDSDHLAGDVELGDSDHLAGEDAHEEPEEHFEPGTHR